MAERTKAVLLNSGGKDSLAAARLLSVTVDLHSIYVDFSMPNREASLIASKMIADQYCAEHHVMPIPPVDGVPWNQSSKLGGIGYQTLILHSIVLLYTRSRGLNVIASGLRNEIAGPGFKEAWKATLDTRASPRQPLVQLIHPIFDFTTPQVVEMVFDDPIFPHLVYCNYGNTPCGICVKCIAMQRAIKFEQLKRGVV